MRRGGPIRVAPGLLQFPLHAVENSLDSGIETTFLPAIGRNAAECVEDQGVRSEASLELGRVGGWPGQNGELPASLRTDREAMDAATLVNGAGHEGRIEMAHGALQAAAERRLGGYEVVLEKWEEWQ